jgi:rhodanese-related sulfurtransferase
MFGDVSKVRRVTPEQASTLLERGYEFVDVSSEPEFEEGHVPGAYNVPLLHLSETELVENTHFVALMGELFPRDAKLVMVCQAGVRSLRAAMLLIEAGYTDVRDLLTGLDGCRDAFGRFTPGWVRKGLPVESGATSGQSYQALVARASSRDRA